MTEQIRKAYKCLFEIRLLHHYWLDEGSTVFDLIPTQARRDKRLMSYDMRSFLALNPTDGTSKLFHGLGGVYKNTALGCIVAVPELSVIPADAMFQFVVTVQSSAFFDYTAFTLRSRRIVEIYHQPERRTYRYKENVPVLSNLTGASRGAAPHKELFLSKEFPALESGDQVESLVLSGNALVQLTGDQPGAGRQQLNAQATKLPVFVHQGDVPVIVPPVGLAGAPARGITLTGDIPDQVFTLIRLSALPANDAYFSLIDGNGHAKAPHPVFQVRFKNRSTIWKYRNRSTGTVSSTSAKPLPLTHFGNAGDRQKPSEGLVRVVKSGTRVTQLVSEVYV
jgi:hypothetical protein